MGEVAVSCSACGNTQCQRRFLRDYLRPAISRTGRRERWSREKELLLERAGLRDCAGKQ
jgi:hypothetical protein